MPLVRTALLATAACLIGAVAYAQPSSMPQTPPPASSDNAAPAPSDMNAPATADTGTVGGPAAPYGAAPVGSAANTSATVTGDVIASAPVPDTPANRRAYGAPLSRAGKMTKPRGN